MIGVEVGEKDTAEPRQWIPQHLKVAWTVGAAVHKKKLLTRHHRNTGPGGFRRRHGAACTTQGNMQSILQRGNLIRAHSGGQSHPHQALGNRGPLGVTQAEQNQSANQNNQQSLHLRILFISTDVLISE